jgi:hypothetical protein
LDQGRIYGVGSKVAHVAAGAKQECELLAKRVVERAIFNVVDNWIHSLLF